MNFDWQWIVAGIMLLLAIFYIIRSVLRSSAGQHDCPDCEISDISKKKINKKL